VIFNAGIIDDPLCQVSQFSYMLFFQLLNRLKSCCFIVSHVLVPCLIELFELDPLGTFNCGQLLLLSKPHVLSLAHGFLRAELIKSVPEHPRSGIVLLLLILFLKLINNSKRWKCLWKATYLRKAMSFSSGRKYTPCFGNKASYIFLSASVR